MRMSLFALILSLLAAAIVLTVCLLSKRSKSFASRVPFSQYGPKVQDLSLAPDAAQGYTVALSGNGRLLATGNLFDNGNNGSVCLWNTASRSLLQTVTPVNPSGLTLFGISVAVSEDGSILAVGGNEDHSNDGAVWVFTIDQDHATFLQKISGTDSEEGQFGLSAALSSDGSTLAAGAPRASNAAGKTDIWTRSSGNYSKQAVLVGTGATGVMQQGVTVTLSSDGNTCATGGYNTNMNLGAVWVFTRSEGIWTQEAFLPCPADAVPDPTDVWFGCSCSLSSDGNVLAVGGFNDNNQIGATWIFVRNPTWQQQGPKLVGSGYNVSSGVFQGNSVSLNGDGTLLVSGGPNDGGTKEGQCWIFQWNPDSSMWMQIGTPLTGTNGSLDADQGNNVALSKNGYLFAESGLLDANGLGAIWLFN